LFSSKLWHLGTSNIYDSNPKGVGGL